MVSIIKSLDTKVARSKNKIKSMDRNWKKRRNKNNITLDFTDWHAVDEIR